MIALIKRSHFAAVFSIFCLSALSLLAGEPSGDENPQLSLFVLQAAKPPDGKAIKDVAGKDLGFAAAKPEFMFGPLLEVVLMAPKTVKYDAAGKASFVDDADNATLLVNFQQEDEAKLQPLFKKGRDLKLALCVKTKAGETFYRVEFAPVSPSLFVLTSVDEMKKLEPVLQKCVADSIPPAPKSRQ